MRTTINIDPSQLKNKTIFDFELQNVNLINLIERLNQNYKLNIPLYEFFNNLNLDLACKLVLD